MSRIFLTGATGFIGCQAAKALIDSGHKVVALIRDGADTTRIDSLVPGIERIRGDISDLEGFRDELAALNPDLCIHLAWYAEPGKYLTSELNRSHLKWTLDLAEFLASIQCRRFVGAGTCLEYDTSTGVLSESSPIAPKTIYARTKNEAFARVFEIAEQNGMSFGWLRFFYQYGPFEHTARLVPSIITALLRGDRAATSSGEQIRDFLHIADVGGAVASAALSDLVGAVNIGSGEPVTVRQVVETIARLCGAQDKVDYGALPQRQGDPPSIVADNHLLRSTGWEPQYSLESGIAETIDWWRIHATKAR